MNGYLMKKEIPGGVGRDFTQRMFAAKCHNVCHVYRPNSPHSMPADF